MNVASFSIEKQAISITFTVLIIAGGLFSYSKLGRLEDPEFTIKNAKIYTSYPGATAMQVAEEVTDEIETAVQQMGQLELVTSLSTPGFSSVDVEIKDKYDRHTLPQVWDELRRKVNDAQRNLPPGTKPSIVYDDFGDVYGIFYAVYGDGFTYAELKDYVEMLRREILTVEGVGDVLLFGIRPEVVYVEISRARLAQLGISPQTIYASLSGQNLVSPSGKINVGSKYINIQPTGEFDSVEDIGELLVLQEDASETKLYLKDIAKIYRGYQEPPDVIMHFNGHQAIGLGISTVEGGNVVEMGEALDLRLRNLQVQTPIGMEIGKIAHQADSVNVSISGFVISLVEAVAIVIGVLMVAMGLRSGVLIGLILVLTVLGTFILMYMNGVMLERISLGALIIALGMLVDNAIVVVEGIIVNMQKGDRPVDAASKTVGQTMWPLFGATIVAILAFAAIGVSQDSTGEYCRSLFQVILYSLGLSWLLAITITPFLGVKFIKVKAGGEQADPYAGKLFRSYRSSLSFAVKRKWLTVIIMLALLFIAIYGSKFIDKSFFPDSTRPQFLVHYWRIQGTDIKETGKDLTALEKYVMDLDGVTDACSITGQGAPRFLLTYTPEEANDSYGLLLVEVDDYKKIDGLIEQVNEHARESFPGALTFCRRFVLGPGDPSKIQARFRGPDPGVLRDLAQQAVTLLRKDPKVTDIQIDWRQPVPLLRPVTAEVQARNAGITRREITNALEVASDGTTMGVYREGDDLLPIIARSPQSEREDIEDLRYAQIYSPVAKQYIPLNQVVLDFRTSWENTIVRRRNRVPTLTVKCDPREGPASPVFEKIRPKIEAIPLPIGYELQWGGEYEDSGDAQAALMGKLPLTAILMIVVVILLFNSFRKPLVIFLTVPLAVIGVTVGLLTTNQPFGFMALLGFLSLSGMLIKNSIVLVDEIGLQQQQQENHFNAILDAGVSRVRPVSMAALTTVLGMIPLLTDAFFVAMAVTIMFGLAFATVLTLIVVPVLYACFYKIRAH
ncbi:Swarming motility protein SwrC [Anaerohalosphaera lusitana]|uniref:Swarming motility protein SwrC n=1 Tax=Anaerohalosphaera lusitana TaxID=1936003 RepID=A0A1U9NJZ4_9BACT|nr:efflux RND transporter permease subunit [Anaerohalosphaera lusitana]AQT67900.1 Swarming motility protein SwrC [Anaerohalosphaera lusitana]